MDRDPDSSLPGPRLSTLLPGKGSIGAPYYKYSIVYNTVYPQTHPNYEDPYIYSVPRNPILTIKAPIYHIYALGSRAPTPPPPNGIPPPPSPALGPCAPGQRRTASEQGRGHRLQGEKSNIIFCMVTST